MASERSGSPESFVTNPYSDDSDETIKLDNLADPPCPATTEVFGIPPSLRDFLNEKKRRVNSAPLPDISNREPFTNPDYPLDHLLRSPVMDPRRVGSDFNPYQPHIPPNSSTVPLEFPVTMPGSGFGNSGMMNNFQGGQAFANMQNTASGFNTPVPGFNAPLIGFNNPGSGFSTPTVGYNTPVVGYNVPANIMPQYAGQQMMMTPYQAQDHGQLQAMVGPANNHYQQNPQVCYDQSMMAPMQLAPAYVAPTNAQLGQYSFDINGTPPFADRARNYLPLARRVVKITGVSSAPSACVAKEFSKAGIETDTMQCRSHSISPFLKSSNSCRSICSLTLELMSLMAIPSTLSWNAPLARPLIALLSWRMRHQLIYASSASDNSFLLVVIPRWAPD